jgi:hypothetical protein
MVPEMKYFAGIGGLVVLFLLGGGFAPRREARDDRAGRYAPIIVELFTSEGCSSCPPADSLLARLEEQQPVAGAEIVALEEHVDYWNHQGWEDPFSAEQWTERQQKYAASRGDQSVYTPQMVVSGHAEFVGSRERTARAAIEQAATQPQTGVSVAPAKSDKRDAEEFEVSVGKLVGNSSGDTAEVWLAITETGLHSAVTRGENAGENLQHAAVVRTLRKVGVADAGKEPSFKAEQSLKLERAWKRQNLRAVVFVQEKRSLRILGAATARIEP